MNVRSLPNKTSTCALSRFPATPRGHPSAVDIPLLCYLFSLPPAEKPLSAASKKLLTTACRLISYGCRAQSCTFHLQWQKPSKLQIGSNLPENSRSAALFAAPVSRSENTGSLAQEWGVQSLFGACLFIQVLISTACLKWGLRCFSLLWYCG